MAAQSSILAFPPTKPSSGVEWAGKDRRPTEAERAYVRAKARQAARAIFEAERHRGITTAVTGEVPCE